MGDQYRRYARLPHCAAGVPASRSAIRAIRYFKRRGVPVFIATAQTFRYATSYRQTRFLRRMGLADEARFNLYCCGDDYPMLGKKDILMDILLTCRVHPSDVCFLDDRPENIADGRSLGIKSFLIPSRTVGFKRYPRGVTPSVFERVKRHRPRLIIFDIDGTLTDEALCEELYPGRLGY